MKRIYILYLLAVTIVLGVNADEQSTDQTSPTPSSRRPVTLHVNVSNSHTAQNSPEAATLQEKIKLEDKKDEQKTTPAGLPKQNKLFYGAIATVSFLRPLMRQMDVSKLKNFRFSRVV